MKDIKVTVELNGNIVNLENFDIINDSIHGAIFSEYNKLKEQKEKHEKDLSHLQKCEQRIIDQNLQDKRISTYSQYNGFIELSIKNIEYLNKRMKILKEFIK